MEDKGSRLAPEGAPENSIALAGEKVGLCFVGKGKSIRGIVVMIVLAGVPGRLGKAMVERSHPRSGHVRDDAIEYFLSVLILVETPIDELPQKSTALGNPESNGPSEFGFSFDEERIVGSGSATKCRYQVANRGESCSHDNGILRLIDQLVDMGFLESARVIEFDLGKLTGATAFDFGDD